MRYLLAVGLMFSMLPLRGEEVYVPLLKNLQEDARLMEAKRIPMVLLFAAEYCSYCEVVMEHFLKPMIRSGEYEDKALIRVLYIDGFDTIVDFDGQPVDPETLAARYHASLTPTVVFLGPDGRELAPPLVGISSLDYYGAYLDRHIEMALRALNSGSDRVCRDLPRAHRCMRPVPG